MTVNFSNAIAAYASAGKAQAPGLSGADGAGSSFGDLVKTATEGTIQVTQAVNDAEVALQTVTAVRDKIVQAYQSIIQMPI